ncbi:MAG: substrate-binding domain-containing protein [Maricaulaceae bacterium]|jgi:phosphate transport system substrate-binding protein
MKALGYSAAAAAAIAIACAAGAQEMREQIRIVGSSTVFPFSTTVAEHFGAKTEYRVPIVESTGTGGGFRLFCGGLGGGYADVSNASRRIKASEFEDCAENGVTEVMEIKIGFDGIVLANARSADLLHLSSRDIFAAVAAQVPTSDEDCTLVDNPNVLWSDVNPELPAIAIEVYGPPPTSGTRDAFVEIAMERGAKSYACLVELDEMDGDAFTAAAHTLREDGAWIDSGENDNAIVSVLERTPSAVGVFGFSFLDQNADRVQGAIVDEAEPTFENIADGAYPISRSLYIYAKAQHFDEVAGLEEFLAEFTSEEAWGDFGYLSEKGLIPLPEDQRAEIAQAVADGVTMTGDEEL